MSAKDQMSARLRQEVQLASFMPACAAEPVAFLINRESVPLAENAGDLTNSSKSASAVGLMSPLLVRSSTASFSTCMPVGSTPSAKFALR
eukprot:CAMPEP_0117512960 /NCGR_PEP_ID=MMETSP0784-20121206/29303_1 /TAXON_ID=39447 /ORGANISM="" /LENGTH=89 /DNA_ID=CAMNT_0005308701 /DNA_START=98 /DNA_END=367 /DNA_ORIENTATION=-